MESLGGVVCLGGDALWVVFRGGEARGVVQRAGLDLDGDDPLGGVDSLLLDLSDRVPSVLWKS